MEQITEQRFVDRLIHALSNFSPQKDETRPMLPGEYLARMEAENATRH